MKGKRLLVSLILGLGLTLALCLTLSARQDAQAAPPQAGVRQELALFPPERKDPEVTIPSTAPYWRDVPVTTLPIENPNDLPGGAWDKIQAQLQRNSYELAPGSNPLLTSQTAKRTADDGAIEDLFGSAVAVSGDTIVVGAYQDDDNGPNSGSVYVFTRNKDGMDNWGQTAKITATDGTTDDQFGYAVAVSGDTIVVGARWDNDNGVDSGSAYVFTRNEGGPDNWGQTAKITAANGMASDEFGFAIDVSGDTVVVGARYDNDNGEDSGSAYIFTRNEGGIDNWGQTTKITATDGITNDLFGSAVAMSGDTVVVGAYLDDDGGTSSGSAYIFTRNTGGADNWGQATKITADDRAQSDYFGFAVAVSGDTIIVGARGDDDNGSESGSVYIFARNEGGTDNWGQTAKIIAADGAMDDRFGYNVAVSGDTVVVGATNDDDKGESSGSAYIFTRNAGGMDNWGQETKITADDGAENDVFGWAVAVSGNTVAIGADYDDDMATNSGAVYLFNRSGNAWTQQSKPTADDGAANDEFGYAVAVSGDTVVVGARYEDDNAIDSGAAYIFDRNEGGMDNWGQVDKLLASDGVISDSFGFAVAVSGDTIVVGAPRNGSDTGSAYVFTRNEGGMDHWDQTAKILANDGAISDSFGYAVAVSGDTIVVGAYQDDDGASNSGSAYVFTRNEGGIDNWGQTTKITAADGALDDNFGSAVAVSGDTVVVGTPDNDDDGSAYIFTRNEGGMDHWGQTAKIAAGDAATGDLFGSAVAMSGDTVVVGAPGDGADFGAAYVFTRNEGGMDNWNQTAKITAIDAAADNFFGYAVGMSGDMLVVGAYQNINSGPTSGSAYVFTRNEGGMDIWGQTAKITTTGGATGDKFGYAVGMSGNTVIVGAPHNDSNGSAYVYRWEYLVPEITVEPTSLAFGDQNLHAGPTLSQTVTITNDGNIDLHISAITQTGDTGEFNLIDSGEATLPPGSTRTLEASFDPSSVGAKAVILTIQSDDIDEPTVDVALSGTGTVAPDITVDPPSLDFGDHDVNGGPTISRTVTITNDGSTDLHISTVTQTGDTGEFNMVDSGGITLTPGSTRTVEVSFDPSSVGPKAVTLNIQSDDDDEPTVDVILSGTGVDLNFTIKAQPDHIFANGLDESTLTISRYGYDGQTVTLTWNLSYYPSPVTITLGAGGVATYTYVAGNTYGIDTITATMYDAGGGIAKTATTTIQLDVSPLFGKLSSVYRGRIVTYTFVLTNVGTLPDTNVVMTGSVPANTELTWVNSGISFTTGGDYGWGYVSSLVDPEMIPTEVHTLTWSVHPLRLTGDILNQARARSDQNVLRLPVQDTVFQILCPLVYRNAEF